MDIENSGKNQFSKAAIIILLASPIVSLIGNGYAFGQWLYAYMHN
jgi:hypothetical protein